MMLYLTGANTSLSKSPDNPQDDVGKSLGGYISSTPVPNGALNSIFDVISTFSIEKGQTETVALGLINKFDFPVENVEIKVVVNEDDGAVFKIGGTSTGSNYSMEYITSRYQEPMTTEFYDASFQRASVDLKINNPASVGEQIILFPFGVTVDITEEGFEGNWNSFFNAFSGDENYSIIKVTEKVFRVVSNDVNIVESPITCSYVSTKNFSAEFLGEFKNKVANSVLLKEKMNPNEAVGIWIQRKPKRKGRITNEEILKNYKEGKVLEDVEEIELIISYDKTENYNNYNEEEYDGNSYS